MALRPSQVETLRIVSSLESVYVGDEMQEEPTVWHLALAQDIYLKNARLRIERLVASGHLSARKAEGYFGPCEVHRLTQLGKEALESSGDSKGEQG